MDNRSSITASYRHVRRISRRSGSNFYRSFWLLPKPKREAMCALYAFARTTDDLGDCAEPISLRTRWLDWWRQTVAINLIGDGSEDQVILPDGLIPEGAVSGTESWPIDLHRRAKEILPGFAGFCEAIRDSVAIFT